MRDDSSRATRIENVGYRSGSNPRLVSIMVGNMIDDKHFVEDQERRKKERAKLVQKEKGYTSQLTDLGKLSRFIEHFDGISLNEQEIVPIGEIENPKETESFKNGYNFAEVLIKAGITEQNYHDFIKSYEIKYNIKNAKHR